MAERPRATYLLSTPITAVIAATFHEPNGLSTIATSSPVSSAPLGNDHSLSR